MAKGNKKHLFWLSYSDLMTSLFFVMLVLFILVYSMQNRIIHEMTLAKEKLGETVSDVLATKEELGETVNELLIAKEELDRIREIEKTINNIDKRYFTYDSINKKHILNIEFLFPTGSAIINQIRPNKKRDLIEAGKVIRDLILKFPEEEDIKYLIVVEGQASKDNWEGNNKLSFYRAQSLIQLWEKEKIGLEKLKNCEIVIAGSGEKGIPRMKPDVPPANQRFLITIIPKIGQMRSSG